MAIKFIVSIHPWILGIPELNISSLDPFFLDEYLLHYDSGDISGKCLYKNVYTSGLMNIQITDVRLISITWILDTRIVKVIVIEQ